MVSESGRARRTSSSPRRRFPAARLPLLVRKETVGRDAARLRHRGPRRGDGRELRAHEGREEVVVNGVTIVGPLNLPSQLAFNASQMFAKNLESFLALLLSKERALVTDYSDEILAASLLVSNGAVTHKPTAELLQKGAA